MGDVDRKRIVFLCSGGGGNLAFIHHALRWQLLKDYEIAGVISDRVCQASKFADKSGLRNSVLNITRDAQSELSMALEILRPDVIVTTIHRIISPEVLFKFEKKIINLHYSLLPSFSGSIGASSVRAALQYPALFSGVTVHEVVADVDAGNPIVQCAIPLSPHDTIETLMPVVFRCGCIALLEALKTRYSLRADVRQSLVLEVLDRPSIFNGVGAVPAKLVDDEEFWAKVSRSVGFE